MIPGQINVRDEGWTVFIVFVGLINGRHQHLVLMAEVGIGKKRGNLMQADVLLTFPTLA